MTPEITGRDELHLAENPAVACCCNSSATPVSCPKAVPFLPHGVLATRSL